MCKVDLLSSNTIKSFPFTKIIVAQNFLKERYKEYGMIVLLDSFQKFEECKFIMMFVVNNINWTLAYSCTDYRGEIATSEINKMIELINSKINSSVAAKKVEVKVGDYKPLKCPCCGGSINSISFCGNDTYVKCEYCDTILTR